MELYARLDTEAVLVSNLDYDQVGPLNYLGYLPPDVFFWGRFQLRIPASDNAAILVVELDIYLAI